MPAGRANTHPAAGSVPSARPGCPLQTSINNSSNLHFGISLFSPHNFGKPLKRAGRGKKLPAVKNPHFLPKAPDKAGSPQGQDRGTPSPVLPIFNEALTNDSSMRAGAFPTLTHPGRAQLNTQLSRMRPETQPKLLEAKEVPGAEEPPAGSSPKLLTSGPPSGSSALSGIYSLLPCKLFST